MDFFDLLPRASSVDAPGALEAYAGAVMDHARRAGFDVPATAEARGVAHVVRARGFALAAEARRACEEAARRLEVWTPRELIALARGGEWEALRARLFTADEGARLVLGLADGRRGPLGSAIAAASRWDPDLVIALPTGALSPDEHAALLQLSLTGCAVIALGEPSGKSGASLLGLA